MLLGIRTLRGIVAAESIGPSVSIDVVLPVSIQTIGGGVAHVQSHLSNNLYLAQASEAPLGFELCILIQARLHLTAAHLRVLVNAELILQGDHLGMGRTLLYLIVLEALLVRLGLLRYPHWLIVVHVEILV